MNILILNIIKNSFQNNQNKQTSTIFFFNRSIKISCIKSMNDTKGKQ